MHSCGVQNLLRLGAPINFDRCATTACAVSPTGSAWQLCSGNPSVATVSIAHSTKRKPPKLGGFILWLRGHRICLFAQWQSHCLHSCGAQNLLRLGAPINFDRCATTACAVSPTGSALQLCSGNPSVATVNILTAQKENHPNWVVSFCGCGGKTRTCDLRVMSPTSYQLLYPAIFSYALTKCYIIITDKIEMSSIN